MQLSHQEVLPDLPESLLWVLARHLPPYQTNHAIHQTFCLLGRSWRDAYCGSRQSITLRLGPSGLTPLAARVLAGSGATATRLELRMHRHARAQLPSLVAALRALPKLQKPILESDGLSSSGMVTLAPALMALGSLRELTLSAASVMGGAALTHVLRHLTDLQHLQLSWDMLEDDGAALAPAIQQLAGLLSLDLGSASNDLRAEDMAATIQHLTSLQKLVLDVGWMGAAATARALRHLAALQELSLSNCRMAEGVGPLAAAIAGLTALRRLRFAGYADDGGNLDVADVAALAHAVQRLTQLQVLDLGSSQLGLEGAAALAPALRQHPALQHLKLSFTSMGGSGAAALAPVLPHMSNLLRLELCYNDLGAEGAEALAPALAQVPALQHLRLGANELGGQGMLALAPALAQMLDLQLLELGGNRAGVQGMAALAPALARMRRLQHLDLRHNMGVHPRSDNDLAEVEEDVGVEGAAALAPALARLTGLTYLDLACNSLGVQGVVVLTPVLAQLSSLRRVWLGR